MNIRNIIKYLVQPNFSWFEYICMLICVTLLPTLGWLILLAAIPIVAVSTRLQERFK